MTRVYDTLRAMVAKPKPPFHSNVCAVIRRSTAIDITNVVEYYNSLPVEQEVSMPTIVSPWQFALYQARSPRDYRETRPNQDIGPSMFLSSEHYGILLMTYRKDDKTDYTVDEIIDNIDALKSERARLVPCHWLVVASLFLQDTIPGLGVRIRWPVNMFYFLNRDGYFAHASKESMAVLTEGGMELINQLIEAHEQQYGPSKYSRQEMRAELSEIICNDCTSYYFMPMLLANAFMHCKNVKVSQMPADPQRPMKHAQKRRGAQQVPHYSYHVLDIEPMKEVLRTEGHAEKTGLTRALHICRGNFATYTDDNPLFGRVTGTFWRPQHVRGSSKAGIVAKDYNVLKPKTGV